MTKDELREKAKQVLTPRELGIFQMMFGQFLVPFLKGRPGTAKSAIAKSIAEKLGMVYIDLRLPTMDEVNLGVFPVRKDLENYTVISSAVPDWAEMTNDHSKFFLINLEELNRAPQTVLSAALGVINERRIGHNFVFGPNVFMIATGNIGSVDGTDVAEFDVAMKSRLKTVPWDMDLADWMEDYAKQHVHPDIVEFLKSSPSSYYPPLAENEQNDVITCGRTWDALSIDITAWYGKGSTVLDYGEFVQSKGKYYVGSNALRFLEHARKNRKYTLKDLLEGGIDISKVQRENRSEILHELEAVDFLKLPATQLTLVIKFLKAVYETDADIVVGTLYNLAHAWGTEDAETGTVLANKNIRKMTVEFRAQYDHIQANLPKFETEVKEETK